VSRTQITRPNGSTAYINFVRSDVLNAPFGYFGGANYAFGGLERPGLRVTAESYTRYQAVTQPGAFTVMYTDGSYRVINLGPNGQVPLYSALLATDRQYVLHDLSSAQFFETYGENWGNNATAIAAYATLQYVHGRAISATPEYFPDPALQHGTAAQRQQYADGLMLRIADLRFREQIVVATRWANRAVGGLGWALRRGLGLPMFTLMSLGSDGADFDDDGQSELAALRQKILETTTQMSEFVSANAVDAHLYQMTSTIGQILGSTLGNYIGGSNPITQVVASATLSTITQNIAQAIVVGGFDRPVLLRGPGDSLTPIADSVLDDFGTEFLTNLRSAAVGTVSSLLSMELASALGLEGFGAQLFGTIGSSALNAVYNNIANYGVSGIWNGFNFTDLFNLEVPVLGADGTPLLDTNGQAITQPGHGVLALNAIGAFLGARLGAMVVQPTTQAGAILSSVGSAVGAYVAISATLSLAGAGASLTLLGNLIVPGIGAFVGFVLGALIGNLFGRKKPKIPTANASTYLDFNTDQFTLGYSSSANGGNLDLVKSMATSARDTLNGFLTVLMGDFAADTTMGFSRVYSGHQFYSVGSNATTIYGHTGNQLWIKYDSPYNTQINIASADEGVEKAVLYSLGQTYVVGGDIFAKRVVSQFYGSDISVLLGDLQVAADYRVYMSQFENINRLIAAGDDSTFAAAWTISLLKAAEIGVDQFAYSDFYGGLQGFLMSFSLETHGARLEDISLSQVGNHLRIALPGGVEEGVFSLLPSASVDGRSVDVTDFFNGYYTENSVGYVVSSDGQITANSFVNGAQINDFIDQSASTYGVTIADYTTWEEAQYWWVNPNTGVLEALEEPIYVSHTVTGGNDIFLGGYGNDTLLGYAGWDWLSGGAGNDYIDGGYDNDVVLGGDGSDTLYGNAGADYVAGGAGNDTLYGDSGDDVLIGGAGGDALYGGDGADILLVDQNDGVYDYLDGSYGADALSFERWTTGVTFALGSGAVFGDGYGGIEDVVGSRQADVITGDAQANRLYGGAGADTLSGGDGDDVLQGGAGADSLNGGSGIDTASYEQSRAGVSVDLNSGLAYGGSVGEDVLTSIENVRGSRATDELKGDAGANRLEGLDGDDWLIATAGADVFDGGDGIDTVDYSAATAGVTAYIGGASSTGLINGYGSGGLAAGHTYINVNAILGSAFGDYLSGAAGSQEFMGGKGNDTLSGAGGSDTYYFELGDGVDNINDDNIDENVVYFGDEVGFNSLTFSYAGGSGGFLDIYYSAGDYVRMNGNFAVAANNRLKVIDMNGAGQLDVSQIHHFTGGGTTGGDTIYGYAGYHDLIAGYGGNDVIYGSGGSWEDKGNVIIGGAGDDYIVTSAGDDQFAFERGSGRDTVTDAGGEDVLVFGPNVAADDVIFKVVGNDLYVGITDFDNPTYEAHQVTDYVRVVNGAIRYQNVSTGAQSYAGVEFVNAGGSWIDLRKLSIDWVTSYTSGWPPIVLDLDGDGLDLIGVDDSLIVSKLASGHLARTSWVGPTDGFLAVDRDGDGQINRSSEVSFLGDKAGAKTDLEGLQAWDTNGDGKITNLDEGWSRLKLWVDTNQNGRSTSSELKTLDEIGIVAINLTGAPTGASFATSGGDSFVHNTLSFTWASGVEGRGYDVELARKLVGGEDLSLEELRAAWGDGTEDSELGRLITEYRLLDNGQRSNRRWQGRIGDTALTMPSDSDAVLEDIQLDFGLETVAEQRADFSDHDNLFAEELARQAQRRRQTPQGLVETDAAVRASLDRLTDGIDRPGRFDRPFQPENGSDMATLEDFADGPETFDRPRDAERARALDPVGAGPERRRPWAPGIDLNAAVERLSFADEREADPWAAAPVTLAGGTARVRWWGEPEAENGSRAASFTGDERMRTGQFGEGVFVPENPVAANLSAHQKLTQAMAAFGPRTAGGAAVWKRSGEMVTVDAIGADTGSSRWRFGAPARISA